MIIGLNGYIGSGKDTIAKMIQFIIAQYEIHGQLYDEFDPTQPGYRYSAKWEIKKFAFKLKQMVSLLTAIPVEDLEKQEVKESLLGVEWNYKDEWGAGWDKNWDKNWTVESANYISTEPVKQMTVRTLLQKLGTDAVRDKVHPNAWVNALMADYVEDTGYSYPVKHIKGDQYKVLEEPKYYNNGFPNWIISDCRFPNEAQAIKDRGGVVWRINRGKKYWEDPEWLAGKKTYSESIPHSSETGLDNWSFDRITDNSGTLEELLSKVLVALKEGGHL